MNRMSLYCRGRCGAQVAKLSTRPFATTTTSNRTLAPFIHRLPATRSSPPLASHAVFRLYSTESANAKAESIIESPPKPASLDESALLSTTDALQASGPLPTKASELHLNSPLKPLLSAAEPTLRDLADITTADITYALLVLRQYNGFEQFENESFDVFDRIVQLTTFLTVERGMRKTAFVYECMMDAMSDPRASSIAILRLYASMEKAGIKWTETFLKSAIMALTVHPNHELLSNILDTMKENWFDVGSSERQNIILAMVRNDEYELAYIRWMDWLSTGAQPDTWASDIMTMVLGSKDFFDEMLEVFRHRRKQNDRDAYYDSIAYFILDKCSSAFHYRGTLYAWNLLVNQGTLLPPDGLLDNVLATAAINGDTALAAAAYERIADRTRVLPDQYDLLLEAFRNSGDFAGAFNVLAIMESLGIEPTEYNEIARALYRRPEALEEAAKVVRGMAVEGKAPVYAVKAVIQAISRVRGSEEALEIFNDMEALCDASPDDLTLRYMIKYMHNLDMRRQMVDIWRSTVAPGEEAWAPWGTYKNLIPSCLEINDLDISLRFAHMAVQELTWKRQLDGLPWLEELMAKAVEQEDARLWSVYDIILEKGSPSLQAEVAELMKSLKITAPAPAVAEQAAATETDEASESMIIEKQGETTSTEAGSIEESRDAEKGIGNVG